jgi:hypothetical protein
MQSRTESDGKTLAKHLAEVCNGCFFFHHYSTKSDKIRREDSHGTRMVQFYFFSCVISRICASMASSSAFFVLFGLVFGFGFGAVVGCNKLKDAM